MSEAGLVWLSGEALSRHTALRTGGACEAFIIAHDEEALGVAMDRLKLVSGTPMILGAGTRTAFRDGPYDRCVLRLGHAFQRIGSDHTTVVVGAGLPCPALAWSAASRGLGGLEDLARTPGSVGAAIALDQGSFREHLVEIRIWSRGAPRWVEPERAARAKLILGARFTLSQADPDQIRTRTRAALRAARALPSWYERPKRGRAEIELVRVGIAGVRLRGAAIPEVAPEMVVNAGRGPASDLQLLHKSALERVAKLRGIELKSAFSFLGRS